MMLLTAANNLLNLMSANILSCLALCSRNGDGWGSNPTFLKPSGCMESSRCTEHGVWNNGLCWSFLKCVESNLSLMRVNELAFVNNVYVCHLPRFENKTQISGSNQFWWSPNSQVWKPVLSFKALGWH